MEPPVQHFAPGRVMNLMAALATLGSTPARTLPPAAVVNQAALAKIETATSRRSALLRFRHRHCHRHRHRPATATTLAPSASACDGGRALARPLARPRRALSRAFARSAQCRQSTTPLYAGRGLSLGHAHSPSILLTSPGAVDRVTWRRSDPEGLPQETGAPRRSRRWRRRSVEASGASRLAAGEAEDARERRGCASRRSWWRTRRRTTGSTMSVSRRRKPPR